MTETAADERARVLVVDDEPMMLGFLRTGLRYEGFEVSTAGGGARALEVAARTRPHLVVLDLVMPGLDGYEVCRRLRGDPDVGIVILTARDEVSDRIEGLNLGADDYLVKPFDFDELLSRLRAVLRRLHRPIAGVLAAGPLALDAGRRTLTLDGAELDVTGREFDLATLLMRHPRQVLPKQLILDRVWGPDFLGGENNVEVCVGTLRAKLGERGRDLIRTVRGAGYQLLP
jgi:DNA-binding response OmpR family regulator